MSTNKFGKMKKYVALAVNLQLVITPSVFGANNIVENRERDWNGVATGMNIAAEISSQVLSSYQQMQTQQLQQSQKAQLAQQLSIKTVSPSQVPAILTQNGCLVLEAKANTTNKMCDLKSTQDSEIQSGYVTAVLEIAENNHSQLENFLIHGHERTTTQGVGCYEKALKQFTAALDSRVEMLNKLEDDIAKQIQAFKTQNKELVESIQMKSAAIDGTPADLAKNINFQDQFLGTECASFIDSEEFKSTGQQQGGGYRGIEKLLAGRVSDTKSGFTPKQIKSKTAQMKADIRKVAKQIASQASRDKSFDGDSGLKGIRTTTLSAANPALTAIVGEIRANAQNEMDDLEKQLKKTTGDMDEVIAGIKSDSVDIDEWAYDYERNLKNTCLNGYLTSNFSGPQGLVERLYDPNISKKANQQSDSSYKNAIVSILNDSEYTIEQKIEKIREEENKSSNSRYAMTTGKSLNIKGKEVGASTRIKASDMVSIFTDNCSEQFESKRGPQGKSPRQIVSALKSFKQQREKAHTQYVAQVQQDIISKMENCPSDTSTGTGSLSCDGALSQNSPSFCIRTANLCANNMLACHDTAKNIFEQQKVERQELATTYKTKMDALKSQVATLFVGANTMMEASARQLDGMYAMGSIYNVPIKKGLVQETLLGDEGIDAELKMEDPEAYLKEVQARVAELRTSIEESNDEILNGPKSNTSKAGSAASYAGVTGEIKKYEDNYKKELANWQTVKDNCAKLISGYNQRQQKAYAESSKAHNENEQKMGALCNKLMAFEQNPAGFCDEAQELGDEVFEIAAAAGDSIAAANIKAFGSTCSDYGSESGYNQFDTQNMGSSPYNGPKDVNEYCEKNQHAACDTLAKFTEGMGGKVCHDDSPSYDEIIKNNESKILEGIKSNDLMVNTETLTIKEFSSTIVEGSESKFKAITENNKEEFTKEIIEFIKKNKDDYEASIAKVAKCRQINDSNSKVTDAVEYIQKQLQVQRVAHSNSDIGPVTVSACSGTYSGMTGKSNLQGIGEQAGRILAGTISE